MKSGISLQQWAQGLFQDSRGNSFCLGLLGMNLQAIETPHQFNIEREGTM